MFSWQTLPKPIFGLAPMDGITDCVYRTMVWRHGPPDVMFTEFVSAEGLSRKIPALLSDLRFYSPERPMIAQIYGHEPEAFAQCVPIIAELGFDGLDINMGCPSKSVVHHGGGAALIKACSHAQTLIRVCAQALNEWHDKTGKRIPLSVKTRLGYDRNQVKDWIGQLLEFREISNISIHGRTLKQQYSGSADWEAIGEAAQLARGRGITILGNGDLQNLSQALQRIQETGVDGVLFGRATYGVPWFFREKEKFRNVGFSSAGEPSKPEIHPDISLSYRLSTFLEHAHLLSKRKDLRQFVQIRKHAGWYLRGFPGAAELRSKLVRVNDLKEMEKVLEEFVTEQKITGED